MKIIILSNEPGKEPIAFNPMGCCTWLIEREFPNWDDFWDDSKLPIDRDFNLFYDWDDPELPTIVFTYVKTVLGKRFPEIEDIIKRSPYYSYAYAKYIIKGRWPEAEDIIKSEKEASFAYARDVIKGKWPEVEQALLSDNWYRQRYLEIPGVRNSQGHLE